MLVTVFALLVALAVAFNRFRAYRRYRNFLKGFASQRDVELHSTRRSAASLAARLVPAVVCVAVAVAIVLRPGLVDDPQSYLTLLGMLAIVFASVLFTDDMYRRVHYTQSGFLLEDRTIPFKSVRELKRTGLGASVVLKNGQSFRISRKNYSDLNEIFTQYGVRVKITPGL